jgi:hypothetical protein
LEFYNGEGTAAATRIRWKKIREVDELDKRSLTEIWVEDLIAIEAALNEWNLEKLVQLGEVHKVQLKFSKAEGSLLSPVRKWKLWSWISKDASSDSDIEYIAKEGRWKSVGWKQRKWYTKE